MLMIVYGVNVRFDYETCECLQIVVSLDLKSISLIKMGRNFFGGICTLLIQEALNMAREVTLLAQIGVLSFLSLTREYL